MPNRQSLDIAGLKLSYLEWPSDKTPILLLHGLADNSCVWTSLGDALADNSHVVAPDLRGHGESSKPASGYSFTDYISDLEALIQHLDWSSCHVIAHSWSAKLLTIWATQNPALFKSLILVDPFFIGKMPAGIQLTFPLLYRVLPFLKTMGPFVNAHAAEATAKGLKQYRGWSTLQEKAFWAGMEQKTEGQWGSKFVIQARNEIFTEVMRVDGLTELIEIPALLIIPEKGLNRMQWQLAPYQKYLKYLEIQKVPGNHWAFLVEPDIFNLKIKQFLHQNK